MSCRSPRRLSFGLVLAAVVLLVMMTGVLGHQAEPVEGGDTEWLYDADCCSEKDCRRAWPGEVELVPGGWRVTSSKETFALDSDAVRQSRDRYFHVCQYRDDNWATGVRTRCLYAPSGMS